MLKLEIITKIGETPIILEASQVLITTEGGDPISVAAVYGGTSGIQVSHCNDPEFNSVLSGLGIDRTVISEHMKVRQH